MPRTAAGNSVCGSGQLLRAQRSPRSCTEPTTAPEEPALPGANTGRSSAFGVERIAGSPDSTSERLPVVQAQEASRPARAPVRGRDEPFALPDPEPPPGARQLGARAYREALARNEAEAGASGLPQDGRRVSGAQPSAGAGAGRRPRGSASKK